MKPVAFLKLSRLLLCSSILVFSSQVNAATAADSGAGRLAAIAADVAVLDVRYPAGSLSDSAGAAAALLATQGLQQNLQTWYLDTQHHCYELFFVNNCLKQSKLDRRRYRPVLDRVAFEAQALQRRLRAEQRDRETVEKQAK
ncbi:MULTISPECIES: hypothetical protein [unclassified Undibacterium]|uniref:hypothetical protein n=1 Tax=unclassified Undibacterium TaxID=2630295 RepID=UPI002AC98F63|nr:MULTISPECIES: hypothetical protein [unclassified Undibacterium]MEB0140301.1 hypothetical protein [Undibacterium sp. CCC2.1]MEB0173576.1 hypothetical protein [Undibacterium sp. CCC1.1]MEB0177209.1 hypothetical protein [Undibacterium sp. CCC3.4]MEB0216474.1 hypothetical protein [Undibacterium sp. 5I2]WPX43244.1 hypothetical protein RHM61_17970 [Undibacterium sp. CCC3.4]